jgi:hypothetical protein
MVSVPLLSVIGLLASKCYEYNMSGARRSPLREGILSSMAVRRLLQTPHAKRAVTIDDKCGR